MSRNWIRWGAEGQVIVDPREGTFFGYKGGEWEIIRFASGRVRRKYTIKKKEERH